MLIDVQQSNVLGYYFVFVGVLWNVHGAKIYLYFIRYETINQPAIRIKIDRYEDVIIIVNQIHVYLS